MRMFSVRNLSNMPRHLLMQLAEERARDGNFGWLPGPQRVRPPGASSSARGPRTQTSSSLYSTWSNLLSSSPKGRWLLFLARHLGMFGHRPGACSERSVALTTVPLDVWTRQFRLSPRFMLSAAYGSPGNACRTSDSRLSRQVVDVMNLLAVTVLEVSMCALCDLWSGRWWPPADTNRNTKHLL